MSGVSVLLIDSSNGWFHSEFPSYAVYKTPSYSVASFGERVIRYEKDSQSTYNNDPLEELERGLEKNYVAIGYIGYDYYKQLEKKEYAEVRKTDNPYPQTYFHFFPAHNTPKKLSFQSIEYIAQEPKNTYCNSKEFFSNMDRKHYLKTVQKIKHYIAAGDIYQLNLSQKFSGDTISNPLLFALKLYRNQPVPYFAYFDFKRFQLISGSMELFLEKKGHKIITRPIKGTIKRGNNSITDKKLKKKLLESAKERAENLMIVDLMRNDLSRICKYGTVRVNNLFKIKKYSTLFQMESEIEGELKNGISIKEIIRATFPPGSVTGAPKSRCLEIIDQLEPHSRGPYCGAIGIFYPNGDFTLSVAIRIVVNSKDTCNYWVGSGIVWDSRAEDEYDETILKAKAIIKTLT